MKEKALVPLELQQYKQSKSFPLEKQTIANEALKLDHSVCAWKRNISKD